jgi:hypothetical protein
MNRQDAKGNQLQIYLGVLAVQNCLADVFLLTSANP